MEYIIYIGATILAIISLSFAGYGLFTICRYAIIAYTKRWKDLHPILRIGTVTFVIGIGILQILWIIIGVMSLLS